MRALIGSSGLVGGTLQRQTKFDDHFRSTNIEEIRGRRYELVVCAGAPAAKWIANRDPEADRSNLQVLMNCLAEVTADHVVLVSTVDVYPDPVEVDEDTVIADAAGDPYGRHRLLLERFVQERFPTTTIRLPGLFGTGLKKNVIYDIIHGNKLDRVCPDSAYQFYDLSLLWADIERIRERSIRLLNLATEPVSVRDLASHAFGIGFEKPKALDATRYDFRTKHDEALGGRGGYLYQKTEVLDAMRSFVEAEGWVRP